MNKIYFKLIAITLTLVLSVSVVVMSSYAWFVLSGNPVATGIQISIGGGNTILVAPDMTQVVDGKTYHYPGRFSDTMNFGQQESYNYLKELGGLTPVSTADGVNWFLPEYYLNTDEKVQAGLALTGELKDVSEFSVDVGLKHGNIPAGEADLIHEGSYIYLDFWVVSPGENFTLRLSTGDDSGGTFVMDQLEARKGALVYSLEAPESMGAAAVRLGFLANSVRLTDETMLYYQSSSGFDERYTSLQGSYLEKGAEAYGIESNRFVIYEPNCDTHPSSNVPEGSYVVTNPVGLVDGKGAEVSVADRLNAQLTSRWYIADAGSGTAIQQRFQAAVMGMKLDDMTAEEIRDSFFDNYLQGQISPYVDKGDFFAKTSDLYKFGTSITANQLADLDTAGATEDVYIIELERNVPQRIRMFIWLEGQDVDCVNEVDTSSFMVNVELAGSTVS